MGAQTLRTAPRHLALLVAIIGIAAFSATMPNVVYAADDSCLNSTVIKCDFELKVVNTKGVPQVLANFAPRDETNLGNYSVNKGGLGVIKFNQVKTWGYTDAWQITPGYKFYISRGSDFPEGNNGVEVVIPDFDKDDPQVSLTVTLPSYDSYAPTLTKNERGIIGMINRKRKSLGIAPVQGSDLLNYFAASKKQINHNQAYDAGFPYGFKQGSKTVECWGESLPDIATSVALKSNYKYVGVSIKNRITSMLFIGPSKGFPNYEYNVGNNDYGINYKSNCSETGSDKAKFKPVISISGKSISVGQATGSPSLMGRLDWKFSRLLNRKERKKKRVLTRRVRRLAKKSSPKVKKARKRLRRFVKRKRKSFKFRTNDSHVKRVSLKTGRWKLGLRFTSTDSSAKAVGSGYKKVCIASKRKTLRSCRF